MNSFNSLSALQQLLDIDTTLMKEELYYPWYIEQAGILKITLTWLFICISVLTLAPLSGADILTTLISLICISAILALGYYLLIKHKVRAAQELALHQVMALEKRNFMSAIKPFVPDDQKHIADKIIKEKDFTTHEYAKITLSSKSRVIFNSEAFIKDIQELFSNPKLVFRLPEADDSYDETKFKVPKAVKKKYEAIKNQSTFNDSLNVPEDAKQAIVKKAYDAMHHAALGREEVLKIKE